MRYRLVRMKPLPVWLRWVLAVILVLNGALAPLEMTHAASPASSTRDMPASVSHCHHHDAVKAVGSTHSPDNGCACCDSGKCQCGCISSVALPITFPDLRPLAPQTFAANWVIPEVSIAPSSLLLRPPIV